ncbi:class I SAM-dependent methyltransferase [Winogradskyella sp.]|uniref:class I SAM-dependent methyltransferase n=1 Tax=Winogradskyella sp. TaxID=1883156 RepID=UPI003BAD91F6
MDFIKRIVNKLPYVRGLYQRDKLYRDNAHFLPGHFYSVIPNLEEVRNDQSRIWKGIETDGIDAIDLNTETQKKLLAEINKYYSEIPFKDDLEDNLRYHFNNPYYLYTDGIVLYGMLRHLKPNRVIEVGSGYSSALMLDVNDLFFDSNIGFNFIEPYTERLEMLINQGDKENVSILKSRVQDVDLEYFKSLKENDILFIDSTHVSKCGSDLNYLLFEVLPVLNEGVYIHFHDIFYPFEYPKNWVFKGYNWNENYLLRAFLMNNKDYSIQVFAHYLHMHHKDVYTDMPLAYKNTGGNLWLRKEKQ